MYVIQLIFTLECISMRENKKKQQQQQQHQYKLYNNNDLEHNVMAFESEKVVQASEEMEERNGFEGEILCAIVILRRVAFTTKLHCCEMMLHLMGVSCCYFLLSTFGR